MRIDVVTVIDVDGNSRTVSPSGDKYTLEEFQSMVGGYIEIVPQDKWKDFYVIVDEEGILKSKPINLVASKLVGQWLVGDVAFVPEKFFE